MGHRVIRAEAERRLDELFCQHSAAIYAFARRRLPGADAEEVVCDVFVVAWRRLDDIGECPRAWLLAVARKTVANAMRAGRRRGELNERAISRAATMSPDHAVGVVAREQASWALGQLSDRDQEILQLAVNDGLTTPEIAIVLGCSTNSASTRLRRARERFAAVYHSNGEGSAAMASADISFARTEQ